MDITIEINLPSDLSEVEEKQLIAAADPENGQVIRYGQEIPFGKIRIVATRKMKKIMGYHPFTTLHVTWTDEIARSEARLEFTAYLQQRRVPGNVLNRYLLSFDRAQAVDEDGTVM